MQHRRTTPAALLTTLCAAALVGCGFQLEGAGALPEVMTTTYVQTAQPHSEFFGSLRDVLRTRGSEVVDAPQAGGATLTILEDSTGQRVLSVSARNTPREYEVFYTVTFSLHADARSLIEAESLVVTRNYTYDETQVLGKLAEERTLRRALASDLARRVVRRIEAARSPTPGG